jgi:hypothetical protein
MSWWCRFVPKREGVKDVNNKRKKTKGLYSHMFFLQVKEKDLVVMFSINGFTENLG